MNLLAHRRLLYALLPFVPDWRYPGGAHECDLGGCGDRCADDGFWINMPRWLNTGLYIFMGWFALFALKPLYDALPTGGFVFLLLGGIMYTVGGVMYGLKKPNIWPDFGFHEVFHVFVMLGSLCHYYAVFRYILMPA